MKFQPLPVRLSQDILTSLIASFIAICADLTFKPGFHWTHESAHLQAEIHTKPGKGKAVAIFEMYFLLISSLVHLSMLYSLPVLASSEDQAKRSMLLFAWILWSNRQKKTLDVDSKNKFALQIYYCSIYMRLSLIVIHKKMYIITCASNLK